MKLTEDRSLETVVREAAGLLAADKMTTVSEAELGKALMWVAHLRATVAVFQLRGEKASEQMTRTALHAASLQCDYIRARIEREQRQAVRA